MLVPAIRYVCSPRLKRVPLTRTKGFERETGTVAHAPTKAVPAINASRRVSMFEYPHCHANFPRGYRHRRRVTSVALLSLTCALRLCNRFHVSREQQALFLRATLVNAAID